MSYRKQHIFGELPVKKKWEKKTFFSLSSFFLSHFRQFRTRFSNYVMGTRKGAYIDLSAISRGARNRLVATKTAARLTLFPERIANFLRYLFRERWKANRPVLRKQRRKTDFLGRHHVERIIREEEGRKGIQLPVA